MSSPKFASITSSLLARKGDAAPSLATLPVRPSAFEDAPQPFPPPPPPFAPPRPTPPKPQPAARDAAPAKAANADAQPERPRRIVITLTHDEFERLGIAAIKMDKNRHDIVRCALDSYFRQLASELPRTCNCMANGSCCS